MKYLILLITIVSLQSQVLVDHYFGGTVGDSNNLATGLIAFWTFDELTGHALDASGGGRFLTRNGTIESSDGKIGGARELSGDGAEVDDFFYYSAETNTFALGNTNFTFAFWIKPNSTLIYSEGMALITKSDLGGVGGGYDFLLFTTPSEVYAEGFDIHFRANGGTDASNWLLTSVSSSDVPVDAWVFVAVRKTTNSYEMKVAIEGDLVINYGDEEAHAGVTETNNHGLKVGVWGDSTAPNDAQTGGDFGGKVDHMGFWLRDLSDCELLKLFQLRQYSQFNAFPCN